MAAGYRLAVRRPEKEVDALSDDIPVRKPNLADQVYAQIRRLIERGDFPPDVRLPTEEELARRFGVSRPVVRDALGRLGGEGIVEGKRGSGTIVRRGPTARMPRFPELKNIADVQQFYEFRIDVEARTATLAAQRRTSVHLAEIDEAIQRSGEAIDAGNLRLAADLNFSFHRAIARASGNRFHQTAIELLPNVVGDTGFEFRIGTSDEEIDRARTILSEHQAISDAIVVGDAEQARKVMVAHITSAQRYLYENVTIDLHAHRQQSDTDATGETR